jgi:radical SAM protein with 4Fe4S-binding SPASM domain
MSEMLLEETNRKNRSGDRKFWGKGTLAISLTSACNLSCRYCGGLSQSHPQREALPKEYVFNVLDSGREYGCKYLALTGGEPLLHPDLTEIIRYGESKGYSIQILTNALLFNEEMCKTLSKFSSLTVRVSMESAQEGLFEYFRGRGTYQKFVEAINHLQGARIPLSVGYAVYPENLNTLVEGAEWSIQRNLDYFRILPHVKRFRAKGLAGEEDMAESIVFQVLEIYRRHEDLVPGNPKGSPKIDPIIFPKQCPGGREYFFVDSDGRMVPCPWIPSKPVFPTIEKVTSEEDFYEMEARMTQIIEEVRKKSSGRCGLCPLRETCSGGCFAEKTSRNTSIFDAQPVCEWRVLQKAYRKFSKIYGSDLLKKVNSMWLSYMVGTGYPEHPNAFCYRMMPQFFVYINSPLPQRFEGLNFL